MPPKYRHPRDGFRPGPLFPLNRGRVGFARCYSKPHNPPASKLEILLEAGQLAAEYLVSKGVLPACSLPANMPRDNIHASRGQDRENPASLVSSAARTSALARLGDHVLDARYGRKRLAEDYDRMELRSSRGRQRSRFYNGAYSSINWDREKGRNGPWRERSRDFSDSIEEDVDNFAPVYHRDRYEEVVSNISRVAGNEQQFKGEALGESGSEIDDAGSKVSSNSTKKDLPPNMAVDENKGEDDLNVSNSESMEDKSSKLDDLVENDTMEKDLVLKLDGVLEGDSVSNDKDLLKLSCFPKVPKRPRTLLAHRILTVVNCPSAECGKGLEFASGVESETARGKVVPIDGSLNDLHIDPVDNLKCVTPANTDSSDARSSEAVKSLFSVERSQLCADTVTIMIDGKEGEQSVNHVGEEKELQKSIYSSSPNASLQNDFSQLDGSTQFNTSLLTKFSQDFEILDSVTQLQQNSSTLVQKVEDECLIMMEEEKRKRNQATSFKICDLNLMEAPEITEIASDHVLQDSNVPSPPLETEKQLSVDFSMSTNNKAKANHDFNQLSSDDKVMMIDLVDDPLIEVNNSDSSKTKNEMIYPAETVLNNIDHSDDLPVIQENYNLAISDYLGSDIPCSPSVEAHLNNLQVGIGLHAAEGFSGVDDAIYGSLGDIGFMEVWDQPTQDYEKFF